MTLNNRNEVFIGLDGQSRGIVDGVSSCNSGVSSQYQSLDCMIEYNPHTYT